VAQRQVQMEHPMDTPAPRPPRTFSSKQVALMVLLTVLLTAAITVAVIASNVFVTAFKPVHLTSEEQHVLSGKIERLSHPAQTQALTPEPYTEDAAAREIRLSEKELNALLAHNTQFATRLAIDLSGDLLSAKFLLPLDPDLPLVGGKTLKINAGIGLAYAHGKPVVTIKGISVWGVPLPNAWIGGVKNIDLVHEYGDAGFWKAFAAGVEDLKIEEGKLVVVLKP
jgi:hypothetical protein